MRRGFSWIAAFILFISGFFCCAGLAESRNDKVEIHEIEWSWNPMSSATFAGVISLGTPLPEEVHLKLSIRTVPDDVNCGEVVFQKINDKNLTLRKQKSFYSLTLGETDSIQFSGAWRIPEYVPFTKVEISCQAFGPDDQTLLAENSLVFSRSSAEAADIRDGKIRIKYDLTNWTFWIIGAAGIIWILAFLRIHLNKKRKGN